jgi:hypothetical protein
MAGQTPPLPPHRLRASAPNKDAGYFWPAWGPEVSRIIVEGQPNTDYYEWKAQQGDLNEAILVLCRCGSGPGAQGIN